ncbi:MAG: hypothetical protein N2652_05695 [Kiritimatiellae bacterium]|nr:hypothetical protein [Kiritimatiellia bacterium]
MRTKLPGLRRGWRAVLAAATATMIGIARADDAARSRRVERDEALDRELNAFRAPISRLSDLPDVLKWPLYKEEPKMAQHDFRPPPPPPPRKKTPRPSPPPPQPPQQQQLQQP